jgi:hypothetical protein
VKLKPLNILCLSFIFFSCSLTPSLSISRSPQSLTSSCYSFIEYFIPSIGEVRLKKKLEGFISEKLSKSENIFSGNELYQILSEHPQAAKKILQYMDQTLKPKIIEQLMDENPKMWPLLAHPCVANNKEKFFLFVSTNEDHLSKLNFKEILLKFELEFEMVKVYRGVSLTKEEFQISKEKGLRSPIYLYNLNYRKQMLEDMFFIKQYYNLNSIQYGGLRTQVEKRAHINPTYTHSVTEHYEIAATVGEKFKIKKDGEAKLYVFEIQIPQLYILGGRFSQVSEIFNDDGLASPFINAASYVFEGKKHFKVGDKIYPSNFEAFIFDDIEPRFILNTIEPTEDLIKTKYEFLE